ncbi:MAG: L17 family ribosomal protein [Candidatus Shapirobacteria bacterium]|jgi:large subunit ribosomal protein L17
MRHRIAGKKLGRNFLQRKTLFRSLAKSVLTHGKIVTTKAKAKAVVPLIEKLVNEIVKSSAMSAQRSLHRHFADRSVVATIYSQVKLAFEGVTSNFTRIAPIGFRQGDNSLMVELSLAKELVKPVVIAPAKIKKAEKVEKVKKVEKVVKEVKKVKVPAKKAIKK